MLCRKLVQVSEQTRCSTLLTPSTSHVTCQRGMTSEATPEAFPNRRDISTSAGPLPQITHSPPPLKFPPLPQILALQSTIWENPIFEEGVRKLEKQPRSHDPCLCWLLRGLFRRSDRIVPSMIQPSIHGQDLQSRGMEEQGPHFFFVRKK